MKLGLHILRRTDAAMRLSRAAPIVKAVNDPTPLMEAPDAAIRVFRYYFADQDLGRTPVNLASIIILALRGYRHPKLYVELYNETACHLGRGLEEHLALTEQATRILHEHGLKVAGFSFATGTPEQRDWAYLKAQNYGGVDALSLHEYWGNQGFSGWNALRYRKVHEWTGGQHPPFVITECGRDRVERGNGGWQRDGISAEQYVSELVAYDAELAKDDYVLGAVVFTAGATEDWRAFDTDPITDLLLERLPTQSGRNPDAIPTQSGEQPMSTLNKNELIEYSRWAQARLQNNEDPRDTQAFVEHLKRLGADWQNPRRYGLPYVEVHPKAS